MNQTAIVIPLRGLHGGKSRLSTVLDPAQRSAIIAAMAVRVVDTVVASNIAESVIIVSRESDLLSMLHIQHASVRLIVQDSESIGLNAAIDAGRQAALTANAETLLVISADLPLLVEADFAGMHSIEDEVVIAPDRFGLGTNAILLRGQDSILRCRFQFGPESRILHEREASRLDLDHAVFESLGLALDLDTPDDWAMLPSGIRQRLLSPPVLFRNSSISLAAIDAVAILERA